MSQFEFIVGYTSDRLSAPVHAVPAILSEKKLGDDGAVRIEADHNGKTLCGRGVSDIMPRVGFGVAIFERGDCEQPAFAICTACEEEFERRRAT
ncbi:hypothetical protein UFOVP1229_67 [uncultured Caudovirales phage]|uniref:Uncharacterized protein n=1 Tax=uncultured Caudovirales phage TaxID=2100421 RepID=A0A6J5R2X9_9CAUD|nr:hypothetical protein UFOVP1229_67 [uncultured Caudovirales phage]